MSDGTVGELYQERFRTTTAGETFTINAPLTTKPDGSAWTPTITDLGGGTYRVSFTPDMEGVWEAYITGDTSGETFTMSFDIALAAVVTGTPATDAVRGTSLLYLVQTAAFRLGDLVMVNSNGGGSDTTLVDPVNLAPGNESMIRRQIVASDGTATGSVAAITDHVQATSTITFTPAMSATPVNAFIINKRGGGFNWNEYVLAAQMAQNDAYPLHWVKVEGITSTFDSTSPTIDVPDNIGDVVDVLYQDQDGEWFPIARAGRMTWPGYQVNDYDNQIIINGDLRGDIDGYTVKVIGMGREVPMTTHSMTTEIHPAWLVPQMCSHLTLMGLARDTTGMYAKQVLSFQQEAESRLRLIRKMRPPSSEWARTS